MSKKLSKNSKSSQKVFKNFVIPGKNPNINNGAIVEKVQWCIQKKVVKKLSKFLSHLEKKQWCNSRKSEMVQ
jgi:hypothetical protein